MHTTLRFFGSVRDSAYGTAQALYAMPILYIVIYWYFSHVSLLHQAVSILLVASLIGMAYFDDPWSALGYGAVLGFVWSGLLILFSSEPRSLWIMGTLATSLGCLFSYKVSKWLHPLSLDNMSFPERPTMLLYLVELLYFGFFLYVYGQIDKKGH